MPSSFDTNRYKKAVASFFDARSKYSRSETHSRMARHFVQLAAPRPSEHVLDIATGTGFVSIPAARLIGENGSVVGIDISAGMLKQAEEAIRAEGLSNIELIEADAEILDCPDSSFDLITCCNALPYMADVPGALHRWHALLRPGGRIAFNCWAEDSHATGHLLRTIAASHGISVPVIGRDTGSPERCRTLIDKAGFEHHEILVEPSAAFFSADHLAKVFETALKSPLFAIAESDIERVSELRDEYMAKLESLSVQQSVVDEMGAYFVLAYK